MKEVLEWMNKYLGVPLVMIFLIIGAIICKCTYDSGYKAYRADCDKGRRSEYYSNKCNIEQPKQDTTKQEPAQKTIAGDDNHAEHGSNSTNKTTGNESPIIGRGDYKASHNNKRNEQKGLVNMQVSDKGTIKDVQINNVGYVVPLMENEQSQNLLESVDSAIKKHSINSENIKIASVRNTNGFKYVNTFKDFFMSHGIFPTHIGEKEIDLPDFDKGVHILVDDKILIIYVGEINGHIVKNKN